jgi:hypothetical protein
MGACSLQENYGPADLPRDWSLATSAKAANESHRAQGHELFEPARNVIALPVQLADPRRVALYHVPAGAPLMIVCRPLKGPRAGQEKPTTH